MAAAEKQDKDIFLLDEDDYKSAYIKIAEAHQILFCVFCENQLEG
jgi:hypothetical protein